MTNINTTNAQYNSSLDRLARMLGAWTPGTDLVNAAPVAETEDERYAREAAQIAADWDAAMDEEWLSEREA